MDRRFDELNEQVKTLLSEIATLRKSLDEYTKETYNRINPMAENLIDWKEKGKQVSGHDNTTIYESSTIIGDVTLGDHCWVGPFTILDGGGGLSIGEHVTIAAGAMIYSHDTLEHTLSDGELPYAYQPVTIERNCFIGAQAIILKGTHIGHHSLIAANAVVRGNIPPYSIVSGNKGKIVGKVVKEKGRIGFLYDEKNIKEGEG